MKFQVMLEGKGNPDYKQYADVAPRQIKKCRNLKHAVRACREYIEKWDLGGGNWCGQAGIVLRDLEPYARVSYNGRVWAYDPNNGKETKEIKP